MAFDNESFSHVGGSSPAPRLYTYTTVDSDTLVKSNGYFNELYLKVNPGDLFKIVTISSVFELRVSSSSKTAVVVTEVPQMNDFYLEVAKGNIAGHSALHKFGRNPDIDVADGFEAIWGGGSSYTGHNATAAEILTVVSSSANDSAVGTGARTVQLFGLDASFVEQNEIVTLNGISIVDTVNSYIRMDRMKVLTAGSSGANEGSITADQKITTANVMAVMPVGYNQTTIAAYTIPFGKVGYFVDYYASIIGANGADSTVRLYTRELGSVFQVKEEVSVRGAGSSFLTRDYSLPKNSLPSMSDVVMRADTDANNTSVTGGFDLVLVDV